MEGGQELGWTPSTHAKSCKKSMQRNYLTSACCVLSLARCMAVRPSIDRGLACTKLIVRREFADSNDSLNVLLLLTDSQQEE